MVVTHVTQWGVPGLKYTRLYGVFSAQLLKTSKLNSHREHHKWMGTRQGTHSADKIGAIETQPHF